MIIEKIINISDETKKKIDIIKICTLLIISFIISFIITFTNNINYLNLCIYILIIYVKIDIFFSKNDSIIHHIFVYLLCILCFYLFI